MNVEAVRALSHDELVALVLAQAEVISLQAARIAELSALVETQAASITRLERRVAELEDKLGKPPKTPDNSSIPPSAGQKAKPARAPAQRPQGSPRCHPARWPA
ncbi:hypothetical protein NI18_20625, partial [Sphingomonas sp. Ant20]